MRRLPEKSVWLTALSFLALLLLIGAAGLAWLNLKDEFQTKWSEDSLSRSSMQQASPTTQRSPAERIANGAYLAKVGNCAGCHSKKGQPEYTGGVEIETPFGSLYSSNLTPDNDSGLGRWNRSDFWRALRWGRSKDGNFLYPAFPYQNFSRVLREDSDDLFFYFKSLEPVAQIRPSNALRFPFNTQFALVVWRAIYFKAEVFEPAANQTPQWNRGAYLVQGLAHCNACHASRDRLGGLRKGSELAGGFMQAQGWYAPSLRSTHEAGLSEWPTEQIVSLLKTGVAPRGSVSGPMAQVVFNSTQHLSESDLEAMAIYLRNFAKADSFLTTSTAALSTKASPAGLSGGAKLYRKHCADCHGLEGQGARAGQGTRAAQSSEASLLETLVYPALSGNRAVGIPVPVNLIQMVLKGGFAPTTTGNARPFGMPPFAQQMTDFEVASILSYVRQSWGNAASEVTELEVSKLR